MAQAVITQTKDMLNSFHQNALLTRPEGRRLTCLEHEMANILARTDLSDRQKMDQFSHTLQNFQKVRGVIIDNGLMLTSTNSTVVPAEEQANQAEAVFSKIQDVIKEALESEKTQPIQIQPQTPNVRLKVNPIRRKSPKKQASVSRPVTRASVKVQKTPSKIPTASGVSGPQYTPYSSSKRRIEPDVAKEFLQAKRARKAAREISGSGLVNFDDW